MLSQTWQATGAFGPRQLHGVRRWRGAPEGVRAQDGTAARLAERLGEMRIRSLDKGGRPAEYVPQNVDNYVEMFLLAYEGRSELHDRVAAVI